MERGTAEWTSLESILHEVHGGLVYRGRGGRGPRATQQFYGGVVVF